MNQMYEPTVFLTNFKGQDITHAKTFGKVRAISQGPMIETFKLDVLAKQVNDALKDSHPEDWLICSGHMILGIIAAVEFLRRHSRVNFLLWHSKQHVYIPRIMRMDAGQDLNDPALQEILQSEVPLEL